MNGGGPENEEIPVAFSQSSKLQAVPFLSPWIQMIGMSYDEFSS